MADLGCGLAPTSEDGPGDDVADASGGFDGQGVKQPPKFVDGDRDQALWAGGAGRCGEERVCGDDESGPSVPGSPAAVLVLVQAEAGLVAWWLGGLEGFLDAPASVGDGDQQWNELR